MCEPSSNAQQSKAVELGRTFALILESEDFFSKRRTYDFEDLKTSCIDMRSGGMVSVAVRAAAVFDELQY